ncbi:MAG TPA: bestrophin family ion channel [Phnomibacter sp.]|nr:bestrophin family ion channel [Phnomibacter sp.]
MLLKKKLRLHRIFLITWKTDIVMLVLTVMAYFVDIYLFPDIFVPPTVATLMGTALAFFIGFNNNQAYSRWWEARIVWGGLINESRNLSRDLVAYLNPGIRDNRGKSATEIAHEIVYRHLGFVMLFKDSLRKIKGGDYSKYLTQEELDKIGTVSNGYNAIMNMQARPLGDLYHQGLIDGFQFRTLSTTITNINNDMGRAERINNTVFPPTYIYFTELFVYLLVILITLSSVQAIGPWSIFFGWVIGFVYHTTHINGLSILNPFDMQPTSIPLDSISRTIEINVLETIGAKDIPPPLAALENGEYIL